jgi:phosphohistidine phosphatase
MNCYFLRHGVAVEPQEWRGSDADRPLTRDGIKRMEHEAGGIARLSLDLRLIVTSPLLRAKQTASIVADELRMRDELVVDDRLANGFNAEGCRAILADHADADSVLLVGHEPTMSAVIGELIGGASVELKKGGLAGVELAGRAGRAGTLICSIPPKVLVGLGKR